MKKISRNSPCLCGSGLKYKKCCFARKSTALITQKNQARQAETIMQTRLTRSTGRTVVLSHQLPDKFKMSDVILEFADGFLKKSDADKDIRSAFGIACQAWNLALLDEQEREPAIERFKNKIAGNDQEMGEYLDGALSELIQHKLLHYAHIKRSILDYQFTGSGDDLRIDVASTLPE